jgi:hypothetical protein
VPKSSLINFRTIKLPVIFDNSALHFFFASLNALFGLRSRGFLALVPTDGELILKLLVCALAGLHVPNCRLLNFVETFVVVDGVVGVLLVAVDLLIVES